MQEIVHTNALAPHQHECSTPTRIHNILTHREHIFFNTTTYSQTHRQYISLSLMFHISLFLSSMSIFLSLLSQFFTFLFLSILHLSLSFSVLSLSVFLSLWISLLSTFSHCDSISFSRPACFYLFLSLCVCFYLFLSL